MADFDPDRTLRPKERKDGTWCVEAAKPGSVTEQIGDFGSESAAQDWIIHESTAYFRQRAGK
jgi:hypothetical protein